MKRFFAPLGALLLCSQVVFAHGDETVTKTVTTETVPVVTKTETVPVVQKTETVTSTNGGNTAQATVTTLGTSATTAVTAKAGTSADTKSVAPPVQPKTVVTPPGYGESAMKPIPTTLPPDLTPVIENTPLPTIDPTKGPGVSAQEIRNITDVVRKYTAAARINNALTGVLEGEVDGLRTEVAQIKGKVTEFERLDGERKEKITTLEGQVFERKRDQDDLRQQLQDFRDELKRLKGEK